MAKRMAQGKPVSGVYCGGRRATILEDFNDQGIESVELECPECKTHFVIVATPADLRTEGV